MTATTLSQTVSATEFNRQSSRMLRLADVGEVIVTDHGVPTYRLTRIAPKESDRLEQLIRAGLFSRPTPVRTPAMPPLHVPIDVAWSVIDGLDEDRAENDS